MCIMTTRLFFSFAIYLKRWVPESARWLLAKGRVEEAQKYLTQCAKMNGKYTHKLETEVSTPSQAFICYNQF